MHCPGALELLHRFVQALDLQRPQPQLQQPPREARDPLLQRLQLPLLEVASEGQINSLGDQVPT
jgi:hypothetical protein